MNCIDVKVLMVLLKAAEDEAERVRHERVKAYEAKKANSQSLLFSVLLNLNSHICLLSGVVVQRRER